MMELFSLQPKITLNKLFTQVQAEEEDMVALKEMATETSDKISNKNSNTIMDKDPFVVKAI